MISIVELFENNVSRSNVMSMVSGHHPHKTASYDEKKPKAEPKDQTAVQQQTTSPEVQQTEITTTSSGI